jgi:hypothetical protein
VTTLVNSFEGGTTTTTLTTGNSGGISGNAFDTVTIGASATLAFDSTHAAHGGLSCEAATGGSSVTSFAMWTTSMGTQTQVWFRLYLYFTANPAATTFVFRTLVNNATACAALAVTTTGKLRALDSASTTITTSAASIPLNQWFRAEGFFVSDPSVGQTEIKLFSTADSPTPTETDTSAATQNTTGGQNSYRYGMTGALANGGPFWIDDIGLSNTGYLGPSVVPAATPAAPGQTWLRYFHHRQAPPGLPSQITNLLSLATSASATGSQAVQAAPVYTTTATATGSQSAQTGRLLAASAAAAGAVKRQAGKTLPAAASAAGSLTRAAGKLAATAATAAGSVTRGIARGLATTATAAGSLIRGLGRVLSAAVSAVGSLITALPPQPPHVYLAQVTITPAGASAATVTVTATVEAGVAVTPAGPSAATVTITVPAP